MPRLMSASVNHAALLPRAILPPRRWLPMLVYALVYALEADGCAAV